MRGLVFGGLLAAAAVLAVLFIKRQPADVYAMPMPQVYDKLIHADFGPLAEGERVLHTKKTASGNGTDTVTWAQGGDMAAFRCVITLNPLVDDADKTHLTVNCDGGSAAAGAASGMLHTMMRNEYIERIDATLRGRPYDKQRAMGATASRWPGDGVDGSLGTAVGEAIRMDAEQRRMQHEMDRDAAARAADRDDAPRSGAEGDSAANGTADPGPPSR